MTETEKFLKIGSNVLHLAIDEYLDIFKKETIEAERKRLARKEDARKFLFEGSFVETICRALKVDYSWMLSSVEKRRVQIEVTNRHSAKKRQTFKQK